MLYESERHESLLDARWDESIARDAIARIAGAAIQDFTASGLWPIHPLDREEDDVVPFRKLYFGAAGVLWALDHLHRVGATAAPPDPREILAALANGRGDGTGDERSAGSLLMGDTGVRLLRWKLDPSPQVAADLARDIAQNEESPTLELMWGSPGTMLAALAMHDWTGNGAWADLFRRSASALLRSLELDAEGGCSLWTQDLYGTRRRFIGAVHGFAGTAFALIRGRRLLPAEEWEQWSRLIAHTIAATALREGEHVNWPPTRPTVHEPPPSRPKLLLQHCHGAPGMVTCLAGLPDAGLDDLLLGGGALIWAAGPLRKGSNLCHGTAGNGYAFLKLFRRTQDPLWLDRARAFAMHAIAQSEQDLHRFGRRRHSLWTGDLGLAIYLWSCIQGTDAFPTMDVF